MKKKVTILQVARYSIQILFWFFFSGLFTLAFTGFKRVYLMILNGNFNLSMSIVSIIPILTVVALTILLGRFFCGWLCAFGTFNDLIYLISSKIFKIKFTMPPAIDAALKYLKYILLVGTIIFIWTLKIIPTDGYNPWDAFAQLRELPQAIFDSPVAFVFLVLIAIGAMFVERFFCRYLCLLGAIQGILSKIKFTKISKPSAHCGKCTQCTKNCPMGINLSKVESVKSAECIGCLKCIEVCPRKNTKVQILGGDAKALYYPLVGLIVFALISYGMPFIPIQNSKGDVSIKESYNNAMAEGSSIESNSNHKVVAQKENDSNKNVVDSKDGSGDVKAAVNSTTESKVITKDGNVVSEAKVGQADTAPQTKAVAAAPPVQTEAPKAVAVEKSTIPAIVESEPVKSTPVVAEPVQTEQPKPPVHIYNDGTYSGTGRGYKPNLTVSVTIKNDKITNVQITSHFESRGYYEEPFNVVPKEIIAAQSTQVDSVTGATRSSNGIKAAVEDALQKAKK